VLDRPSHLHQRGNQNRNIGRLEIAAYESVSLQWVRADNAHTAVAQIMNTTIEGFGHGARGLTREQAAHVSFQYLGEPLMLASFSIGGLRHA